MAKQSPKVKLAQEVVKKATKMTKRELKSKEIIKEVVTYPKGLYAKTLKKNYGKAATDLGLRKAKPAKKKTAKKTVRKSTSRKKK